MRSILVLLFLINFFLYAEEDQEIIPTNNLLTFNFLDLIPVNNVSFASINYQRRIDESSSFGGLISVPVFFSGITGYRSGLEYRYFPLGTSLKKLYLAPRILYTDINDDTENESFQVITLGMAVAWNFQGKHFSFNLGVGLDYNTGPSLQQTELQEGVSNTTPNLRLSFGWSW